MSDHDIDLGRAILIASEQISNALLQVAISNEALAKAVSSLVPPKATSLLLQYKLRGGKTMGAPVTAAQVGQVYDPTVVESNATTPSIQPIGPVVFASDNAAVVAVDPNTGIATMVAAGSANVSVLDQGNNLTDTVAFTVTAAPPPVADKVTLSYNLAAAKVRK